MTIIDVDQGGNGNDVILETTTDSSGRFSGLTREWVDTNNVRLPNPLPVGPRSILQAVPDVLLLQFRVRDGQHVHSGPFLWVNETTSVPIVVPWLPQAVLASVNGKDCRTAEEITAEIFAAVKSGNRIDIEVFDPVAVQALSILDDIGQLKAWLAGHLPNVTGPGSAVAMAVPGTGVGEAFWILLAVAVLILAAGASAVLVSVGIGLIWAIVSGYQEISVVQEAETTPGGSTVTKTRLRLRKSGT